MAQFVSNRCHTPSSPPSGPPATRFPSGNGRWPIQAAAVGDEHEHEHHHLAADWDRPAIPRRPRKFVVGPRLRPVEGLGITSEVFS